MRAPSSPPFGGPRSTGAFRITANGGAEGDHDALTAGNAASDAGASGPRFPRAAYERSSSPLVGAEPDSRRPERGDRPFVSERTPPVIVDGVALAGHAAGTAVSPRAVPTAEFGAGGEPGQQTRRRDAVDALLRASSTVPPEDVIGEEDIEEVSDRESAAAIGRKSTAERGDPTFLESGGGAGGDIATERFDRLDPTQDGPATGANGAGGGGGGPDATEIQAPRRTKYPTQGTLRRAAALRRKRGLYGDVRYVFTALMGVRRARRELTQVEHRHEVRGVSRRRHLITLGRAAATMDVFEHPALARARDRLTEIEDERAKHAGAVAASDAELDRVRRDRDANVKATAEGREKAHAAIAELAKKLEPVEKEAASARKKATELRDEVARIDRKIGDTEAKLVTGKAE
jgi:hypothetical protein